MPLSEFKYWGEDGYQNKDGETRWSLETLLTGPAEILDVMKEGVGENIFTGCHKLR